MQSTVETIQRESVDALRDVLPAGEDVALLDHPSHFNAGDLLIYQGELGYLEQLGKRTSYVCTTFSYDRDVLAKRLPTGALLLHGGGNFGDRYPKFQHLRERAIADHPDRKIIQLPQTIEFRDGEALEHTQRIYSAHPDLTLMIRDKAGLEQARDLFPDNNVVSCPDMAFGVGEIRPVGAADNEIVLLKRQDQESLHSDNNLPDNLRNAYRADWHITGADNAKWWPVTILNQLVHHVPSVRHSVYPLARKAFDWQADIIVRNAVRIMSHGEVVVTDRLHAAVYAILMGKNVVMVDNANKKISNIYRDYLSRSPMTHLARDFDEAGALAQTLL